MQRQRGADRMVSVRRLLAAEHPPLHGFAADLVAEHFDDPAYVVQVGLRCFGTSRRLVWLYFRVDREGQIRVDQRGIDASVFRKFQYGLVAARRYEDEQTGDIYRYSFHLLLLPYFPNRYTRLMPTFVRPQ